MTSDVEEARRLSLYKLQESFASIFDKYDRDFEQADEVDLETLTLITDNGHLNGLAESTLLESDSEDALSDCSSEVSLPHTESRVWALSYRPQLLEDLVVTENMLSQDLGLFDRELMLAIREEILYKLDYKTHCVYPLECMECALQAYAELS